MILERRRHLERAEGMIRQDRLLHFAYGLEVSCQRGGGCWVDFAGGHDTDADDAVAGERSAEHWIVFVDVHPAASARIVPS